MLDSKVKPDSEARIACVGTDEEVKFKLTNVVYTSQITYRQGQKKQEKDWFAFFDTSERFSSLAFTQL